METTSMHTGNGLRVESDVGMMRETQLQALSLAIAEAQPSGLAAILLTFDGSRSTPESGEAFVQEKTLSAILTRSAESVGAAVAKKKKKKKASGKSFARTKGSGHGENTAKRCRAFDEIFRSIVAAARHESSTLQHLRFEALPLFGGDHSGEMIKGGAAGRGRRRNGARGKKSGSAAAAHWKRQLVAKKDGKGESVKALYTAFAYSHALARALRVPRRLTTLEIPDSGIGKSGPSFAMLLEALRASSTVTALNISGCALDEDCGVQLCALLKRQRLSRDEMRWALGLRQTMTDETEKERTTRDAQCRHHGLMYVDASRNALGDRTTAALAATLVSDRWFAAINLQGNVVSPDGLALLRETERDSASLEGGNVDCTVIDCRAQRCGGTTVYAAEDGSNAGPTTPRELLGDAARGGGAGVGTSNATPGSPAPLSRLLTLSDGCTSRRHDAAARVLAEWPFAPRAAPRNARSSASSVVTAAGEDAEESSLALLAYPAPSLVVDGGLDIGRLAERLDEEWRARKVLERENAQLRKELESVTAKLLSDSSRATLDHLEETIETMRATILRLEARLPQQLLEGGEQQREQPAEEEQPEEAEEVAKEAARGDDDAAAPALAQAAGP